MSNLIFTKKRLETPVSFTQVRLQQDELVGNSILIASGQEVYIIKAVDLVDHILNVEQSEGQGKDEGETVKL